MKKVVSVLAVLIVCVLALTSCTIELGDLEDSGYSYLSVESLTVAVGETAEISYESSGLEGDISFEFDSDCISIEGTQVTGLKEGTVTVTAVKGDMDVEFEVEVVAAAN